jgi:hypothetical protein
MNAFMTKLFQFQKAIMIDMFEDCDNYCLIICKLILSLPPSRHNYCRVAADDKLGVGAVARFLPQVDFKMIRRETS